MPFTNVGGEDANEFSWSAVLGNRKSRLDLTADQFVASLDDDAGNPLNSLSVTPTTAWFKSEARPPGLVSGPSEFVGFASGVVALQALDEIGAASPGQALFVDHYGVHCDNAGGATSPTIRTSADYSDQAPDSIPAESGLQQLFVGNNVSGNLPTSGTFTLSGSAGPIGPINYNDGQTEIQAAFDTAYGAGEVTVTAQTGPPAYFDLDFSPGTLADQRIELLTVSANSLDGWLTSSELYVLFGLAGGRWGKALGLSAAPGSLYQRNNSGVGELWIKSGSADTAWTKIF